MSQLVIEKCPICGGKHIFSYHVKKVVAMGVFPGISGQKKTLKEFTRVLICPVEGKEFTATLSVEEEPSERITDVTIEPNPTENE